MKPETRRRKILEAAIDLADAHKAKCFAQRAQREARKRCEVTSEPGKRCADSEGVNELTPDLCPACRESIRQRAIKAGRARAVTALLARLDRLCNGDFPRR